MSRDDAAPIGLLGGSFDPVHAGHLQLARDAQARLGLPVVHFVPAGRPWQKGAISPAGDRLEMLALALQGHASWSIDACEIERPGPSYTVDSLAALRQAVGAQCPLVWIMGFDQLRALPSWHRWQALADLAHIAFARRAGAPCDLDAVMGDFVRHHAGSMAHLHAEPAGRVVEFPMQPVDCSATMLRAALARGDTAAAAPFLAPAVLEYIRERGLYLAPRGA